MFEKKCRTLQLKYKLQSNAQKGRNRTSSGTVRREEANAEMHLPLLSSMARLLHKAKTKIQNNKPGLDGGRSFQQSYLETSK